MAVAVFGLTACVPGVISCHVTKFICEQSDKKCREVVSDYLVKRSDYESEWESLFQKKGWQNPKKAVDWGNLSEAVKLLTPHCPHTSINKNQKGCPKTAPCGLLRRVISLEIALTQAKLSPSMKLEETQIRLCSLVSAIALTIFTSAIIPLPPLLMTIHL
ncbi:MAG: hypothetical protein K2X08_02680, partial [Chlamydiales bacterium]|nr:hypothetical protein [Chlamydiales bacterium]